jgi:hypothetical protein
VLQPHYLDLAGTSPVQLTGVPWFDSARSCGETVCSSNSLLLSARWKINQPQQTLALDATATAALDKWRLPISRVFVCLRNGGFTSQMMYHEKSSLGAPGPHSSSTFLQIYLSFPTPTRSSPKAIWSISGYLDINAPKAPTELRSTLLNAMREMGRFPHGKQRPRLYSKISQWMSSSASESTSWKRYGVSTPYC